MLPAFGCQNGKKPDDVIPNAAFACIASNDSTRTEISIQKRLAFVLSGRTCVIFLVFLSFYVIMCESENLIMAVEKYPCLWDIHHEDYHNRDIQDLAWEQIRKDLYNDWDKCTDKTNKCNYYFIF